MFSRLTVGPLLLLESALDVHEPPLSVLTEQLLQVVGELLRLVVEALDVPVDREVLPLVRLLVELSLVDRHADLRDLAPVVERLRLCVSCQPPDQCELLKIHRNLRSVVKLSSIRLN